MSGFCASHSSVVYRRVTLDCAEFGGGVDEAVASLLTSMVQAKEKMLIMAREHDRGSDASYKNEAMPEIAVLRIGNDQKQDWRMRDRLSRSLV